MSVQRTNNRHGSSTVRLAACPALRTGHRAQFDVVLGLLCLDIRILLLTVQAERRRTHVFGRLEVVGVVIAVQVLVREELEDKVTAVDKQQDDRSLQSSASVRGRRQHNSA